MADEQPEREIPKPPNGLMAQGKRLWNDIWAVYTLTAGECAILETACRARDEVAVLQKELKGSTRLVAGSMGQPVMNPLVVEIRQQEKQVADLIATLKLPDISGAGAVPINGQREGGKKRWEASA